MKIGMQPYNHPLPQQPLRFGSKIERNDLGEVMGVRDDEGNFRFAFDENGDPRHFDGQGHLLDSITKGEEGGGCEVREHGRIVMTVHPWD